jgi:hypothetical protein
MTLPRKTAVSLALGVSLVWVGHAERSRFNGFFAGAKAAEAAGTASRREFTGLKPGAN